jgi:hypothetical protein
MKFHTKSSSHIICIASLVILAAIITSSSNVANATDITLPSNVTVPFGGNTTVTPESTSQTVIDVSKGKLGTGAIIPAGGSNTPTGGAGGSNTPTGGAGGSNTPTGGAGGSNTPTGGAGGSNSSGCVPGKLCNPLTGITSVGAFVSKFIEIFSYVVILFAVLALVWTGLQYILAQGKPDKLTELSRRLLWIVIGIAIVIGARIIVQVVINTLSATGSISPGVIQQANQAINTR